ncbi:MAG: hypothetical protein ACYTKD_17160 [Planctomycetota bacterium]
MPPSPFRLTTTYLYENADFPHFVTGITDPRGVTPITSVYDGQGRLVATIDAYGNRIELEHDLPARTETVYDRAGNPTVHGYDERGNVTLTGSGFAHLKGPTALRELFLTGAQVTDAGLVHLKGLTGSKWLVLRATQVTDAGVAELEAALPGLEVTHQVMGNHAVSEGASQWRGPDTGMKAVALRRLP